MAPGSQPAPPDRVPAYAYLVALAVYVALGLVARSLVLNWIVGPLFPMLVLYLIPRTMRRRLSRAREARP